MRLLRDTGEYASWLWRATRRLAQVDRGAAVRLIASMSVNQIVTFLVFFLPLKVVLLVASDGVGRYFQFFVTKETKSAWIAGISAAILILYVVSIRLDTIADRNATQGAKSLIKSAEQVPITSDPEHFAKTTFYRIGETIGGVIFSVVTLAPGAVVFPSFFLAIPLLLVIELIVVAVSLSERCPSPLKRFGTFVSEKPQQLINWLRQINFLLVFSVLILLFLTVEGLNPLLGIAAILLSRRVFGAWKNVARDSLKLSADRRLVDALLFADARVRTTTQQDRDRLLGSALPSARLERLRSLARAPSGDDVEWYTDDPTTVELMQSIDEPVWVDSGQGQAAIFDLYGHSADGARERWFRDYLYSRRAARGLEQHDYLLRFLNDATLRCPSRVVSYRYEGLVGRIVDYRGISEADQKRWQAHRQELLEHLWSVVLPDSLVEAYFSVHHRLHERLRGELLGPLKVAVDEPWAQSTYGLLASKLPQLCELAAELPVVLFNERLGRRNVVTGPDGLSRLLDWTSWTLRPVGAGFVPDSDSRGLLEVATRSANIQLGATKQTLMNDVLLTSLLQRMDRLVQEGYPKTALSVAHGFLPLVEQPEQVLTDDVLPELAGQPVA